MSKTVIIDGGTSFERFLMGRLLVIECQGYGATSECRGTGIEVILPDNEENDDLIEFLQQMAGSFYSSLTITIKVK